MALVALPHPVIITPILGAVPTGVMGTGLGSASTFTFNAAGDKIAIMFHAQSTTVPDLISFYVSSVTTAGTTGNIEATLENITTGDPSGAVTNSATGSGTISTTGAKTISGMAGTATVTAGNMYAVVLTAGAGWDRNLAIRIAVGSTAGNQSFPIVKTKDTAGAWTYSGGNNVGFNFGLADSGGTYIQQVGFMGAYDAALQAFSSSTNPDERGNRFSFSAPVRIVGAQVLITGGSAPGANDDYTVKLLSSHTGTPTTQRSITVEGEANAGFLPHTIMFSSGFDAAASTVYALTVEALGSETQSMCRWDYPSNAHLAGILGTSFYATTRNDLGSCTDDNDSLYSIFPIISHIDDATGSGGGLAANPSRGFIS